MAKKTQPRLTKPSKGLLFLTRLARQSGPRFPDEGFPGLHLEETIQWILRARAATDDWGIPAFYDVLRRRWAPSYPETTAYTIPTLCDCADYLNRPELLEVSTKLANYLCQVRTPEGGIGHWKSDNLDQTPVIFDTGQAIFGWLAIWRKTHDQAYLRAAKQAADWLVATQDESGAWLRYQHLDRVKVIDTRVSWALLKLGQVVPNAQYMTAARRNLDWAIQRQLPNGWFECASFRAHEDPFTHAIAYVVEGLLESGIMLNEQSYISAAEKAARALRELQQDSGFLASTFNSEWRATSLTSCLTGDCQMATVWLRLHRAVDNDPGYLEAAHKAIAFVTRTQNLRISSDNIRGAVAGSYPIFGRYERFHYPNWAAKFLIDALLAVQGHELLGG